MNSSNAYLAIVDDNNIFRYVTKHSIAHLTNFQIHIEAINGKDFISKLEQSSIIPDICILDIGMPEMNGYETIKILQKKWPSIKVLVFSQYYHTYAIETMISFGARAFISKEENIEILIEALTCIHENGYYYSKIISPEIFSTINKRRQTAMPFTKVEKQILSLLCKDIPYHEIANTLFKSKHTIEKHKQNISKKIGIHSREGLILFAIKNELIDLHESQSHLSFNLNADMISRS